MGTNEVKLSAIEAMQNSDPACPGENWFLYWRTSSSLWRSKIENMKGGKSIIVPINWSFHSETGDHVDFGNERPEANLARLVEMAEECNRSVHFYLPVTPAPFLPNGGLPHFLARQVAQGPDQLALATVDALGQLLKIHSFFDPRVFQSFTKFIGRLSQYFNKSGVNAKLWGMECGYVHLGGYQSFLFDRSKTYNQAFTRYMTLAREEAPDLEKTLNSLSFEKKMNTRFLWTIRDLYVDALKKELSNHFEGVLKYAFIGASPFDFMDRACGNNNFSKYSNDMLDSLCRDVIPSSILIPRGNQNSVYTRQVDELVSYSFVSSKLDDTYYEEDRHSYLSALVFFHLFLPEQKVPTQSHIIEWENSGRVEERWKTQGFFSFLLNQFPYTYNLVPIEKFRFDETVSLANKVLVIDGELVDQKVFNNILKVFMSGGQILLDRSNLSPFFLRKLETFFLENSLLVEKIFFHTNVHSATLGDGKLILYEGALLNLKNESEKSEFWKKLVGLYNLLHIQNIQGDQVSGFWRTRASSPSELNYEEVRRLSLYNGTSYKKKVKLPLGKNFALLKILDEQNAVVQSYPHQIEVQLLPEGAVSIDFGVFGP